MTTTPTASPELPDLDHLEALARAADQGEGQHIYTNPRDSNCWQANEAWHRAASPAAVLDLIALARRAALANQTAPTVPADAMPQFAAWKGYELPALNSDGHFDKDWLHREWRAFQAGMARAAHQPAQEQAGTTRVTETKRTQLEARGYEVVGYVMQNSVNELCTLAHGRVEWLGKPAQAAQQEPVAAPQQAAAPGALPERDLSKPAEQQGLFRKFDVRRTDDSDQPGGKHHGCRYYVLDLTHDQHAPAAMRAYAAACASTHPQLAADIVAEFGTPGTPEAPKPAHGHRDDYYLLANGRRLGLEPISRVRNMPNWVLAMELFATGSTSAHQLCRDAGVDPDSTTTQRAAQLDGGQEGSGE